MCFIYIRFHYQQRQVINIARAHDRQISLATTLPAAAALVTVATVSNVEVDVGKAVIAGVTVFIVVDLDALNSAKRRASI